MNATRDDEEKLERLRDHLEGSGKSFVVAKHVPGMSSFEAARVLRLAEERGLVETWSDGGNRKKYRVLL